MLFLFAILYLGVLVYLVNQEEMTGEQHTLARVMVLILILFMPVLGLNVLGTALMYEADPTNPDLMPVTVAAAGFYFVLSLGFTAVSYAVFRSRTIRLWIQARLNSQPKYKIDTLSQQTNTYNPDSMVHTVAIVIANMVMLNVISTFLLIGGLEGLAESYGTRNLSINSLFFDMLIYILMALLGVGLFIRRNGPQVLVRLGLRFPTLKDWQIGVGMGVGLYAMLVFATSIWSILVPPEIIEQQTAASGELFAAFSASLLAGLALAITAGIGEEILFRGALQPVFGWWATSIFFTLLHIQYTLTPAAVIILLVSLGFGWVRKRYNTTTAIIAHAIYNAIPFILVTIAAMAGTGT